MKGCLPVRVVAPLAGMGTERLDVLPNPRSPIADHTTSDLIFGYHARRFALLEGLTQVFLVVPLMPAQQMDKALGIEQLKPQALGIAPLAMPCSASSPTATRPALALPGAFGTRGHGSPLA